MRSKSEFLDKTESTHSHTHGRNYTRSINDVIEAGCGVDVLRDNELNERAQRECEMV